MTWEELVNEVSQHHSLSKAETRFLVHDLFDRIATKALHGERVPIPGFGVFVQRKRKARNILHPQTGRPMELPATTTIGFRLSGSLKR